MKPILMLLATVVLACAQTYMADKPMTKGNVTVTLQDVTVDGVQDRFHLVVDTKDPAVNAFKVTLRMDYKGIPISRSFLIPREQFNHPLAALITNREIAWPVWGQVSWVRYILVEEQKTASGIEF